MRNLYFAGGGKSEKASAEIKVSKYNYLTVFGLSSRSGLPLRLLSLKPPPELQKPVPGPPGPPPGLVISPPGTIIDSLRVQAFMLRVL